MAAERFALRRGLGLVLLTLYGLGTTIGAGIYVLIGEVAGRAGYYAPLCFLVATVLVAFTALSFGELAARMPKAAGEATYVRAGFGAPRLALAVGLMVALAGTVSAAAIINGSVGYLLEFVGLPPWLLILALGLTLVAVAGWGIVESVTIAATITVLEIGGLLAVVAAGLHGGVDLAARWPLLLPPAELAAWSGILGGAVLAFYAFIGFEDMVNVAEEVKDVERVMPIAIVLTLGITALLYLALATTAILVVPPAELAASAAPLARVFERGAGLSSRPLSAIAVVATLNGALVQIIMAARVLYGLSAQGSLPAVFGRVDRRTRTPLIATFVVGATVLVLAYGLPLASLAEATSIITLAIFTLVNLSLWRIKRIAPAPAGIRIVPALVPVLGCVTSAAFLLMQGARHWPG
jgi:amino acid transporter